MSKTTFARHDDYTDCFVCLTIIEGIKKGKVRGEDLVEFCVSRDIKKKRKLYHENHLIHEKVIRKRRRLLESNKKIYKLLN